MIYASSYDSYIFTYIPIINIGTKKQTYSGRCYKHLFRFNLIDVITVYILYVYISRGQKKWEKLRKKNPIAEIFGFKKRPEIYIFYCAWFLFFVIK